MAGEGNEEELLQFEEEMAAQDAAEAANAGTGENGAGAEGGEPEDPELELLRSKIAEVEEEAEKLKSLQEKQKELTGGSAGAGGQSADSADIDSRSIHVGNVDFTCKPEELQQHFSPCGSVVRVTILVDKATGRPKGYAYLEFTDPASVELALSTMDGSILHNRPIKVVRKRTNVPAFMRGVRARGVPRGRGRGFRGGGRRGFRGGARNRAYFAPYPTAS